MAECFYLLDVSITPIAWIFPEWCKSNQIQTLKKLSMLSYYDNSILAYLTLQYIGVYFVYVTNDLENVLSTEYILSWMKTLDWGWTFNRLMIMGLWPINKLFSNIKTNNVSSYWIKQCWSMHQKKTCLYFRRYMHRRTG